jgi:hypothetical protein
MIQKLRERKRNKTNQTRKYRNLEREKGTSKIYLAFWRSELNGRRRRKRSPVETCHRHFFSFLFLVEEIFDLLSKL